MTASHKNNLFSFLRFFKKLFFLALTSRLFICFSCEFGEFLQNLQAPCRFRQNFYSLLLIKNEE